MYAKGQTYAKGEVYTKEETNGKTTLTAIEGNPNGYTLGDNDGKELQAMLSDD